MKNLNKTSANVTIKTKLGDWDKYPITLGQRFKLTMKWLEVQIADIEEQCALNVLLAGTPANVIEPIRDKHIAEVWKQAVAYLKV